jgi:hypothetical protein
MTTTPTTEEEALVFDKVEAAEPPPEPPAPPACASCKRPLGRDHYTINADTFCEDCHHLLSAQLKESKSGTAFMRAAGLGALAAIGGSVAWYVVTKITGMQLGLLAIAVGYVVGRAVRKGSRSPGGKRYQALAMLLTYLSIAGSYIPIVLKTVSEPAATSASTPALKTLPGVADPETEVAVPVKDKPPETMANPIATFVLVLGVSLIAPFLGGASNIIGIALILIALYEAWKLNRGVVVIIEGPLRTHKLARPPLGGE